MKKWFVLYVVMFTRERLLRSSARYVKHRLISSNCRRVRKTWASEHVVGVAQVFRRTSSLT